MSTATATRRERLEKTLSEIEAHAADMDAKGVDAPAEDFDRLEKLNDELASVLAEVEKSAKAGSTIDAAKGFLGELAGPGGDAPGAVEVDSASGIAVPDGRKTLGELFTASPAYQEWAGKAAGPDGKIRDGAGNSDAFDAKGLMGAQGKTLVTGLSSTSGGAFVTNYRYGPVADQIGERRLTIRDLCTNITINSDTFEFVQVTGKTNNAAPVLEATTAADPATYATYDATHGLKPESAMTFAVASQVVETIAHLIPISRRAAADAPQVRQLIDAFLLYGLKEEEEDQILNGDGTSPNLKGITDYSISTVGSAGTDIDAVVDAIRTIRADRREPTGLVVHPNDWYSTGFLLAKDSAGNYLIGDPRASLDVLNSLWGLRVVVTPAQTENTLLVGDFSQYVVADREQSTIYVSDSHKDWFQRNLLAVLAEERLAGACLDEDAFCSVTAV